MGGKRIQSDVRFSRAGNVADFIAFLSAYAETEKIPHDTINAEQYGTIQFHFICKEGYVRMQPMQDEFLEKLYKENFNKFELYARAMLGDYHDAQVAVQDAFHIACEKIDDVMGSENPVGWMKLVIRNVARNMIKSRNRDAKMLISLSELQTEPGRCDDSALALLDFCRSTLAEQEYELIRSIVIDGMSYREKAEQLGISLWACYKRMEKARVKLKEALQNEK